MRMFLLSLLLLLAACSLSQEKAPPATNTVSPALVETALQELLARTAEALPTQTITLGPSPTPSPFATAQPSASPLPALTEPHGDGIYLVGVEIAAGAWLSEPLESGQCYWTRLKDDGVILESYYGPPGVTMRIQPGDYQVELIGCGTWTYLGP